MAMGCYSLSLNGVISLQWETVVLVIWGILPDLFEAVGSKSFLCSWCTYLMLPSCGLLSVKTVRLILSCALALSKEDDVGWFDPSFFAWLTCAQLSGLERWKVHARVSVSIARESLAHCFFFFLVSSAVRSVTVCVWSIRTQHGWLSFSNRCGSASIAVSVAASAGFWVVPWDSLQPWSGTLMVFEMDFLLFWWYLGYYWLCALMMTRL